MSPEKYYITTPIFYPNARPHVGSAFEVIGIDVMARWKRLLGHEVFFLTGTDEHAAKVGNVAAEKGLTPEELVEEMAEEFKCAWRQMEISHDRFIRTEEEAHKRAVAKFWRKVRDKGDIYLGAYEGLYCMPCESYWTTTQAKAGACPECGRPLETLREPAYFFALSRYQKRLEELFSDEREFLVPEFRRREMQENFLKPGLADVCISRTTIHWGIPVPDDPQHVIYVWFDALINYLTGAGYGTDDALFEKWWPADLHVVGKDIVRFHTLLWPAMLMSADLPVPGRVFGHGFVQILSDEDDGAETVKMSKSLGNVVTPGDIIGKYGADALRYFLMREITYAGDGAYSERNLAVRYNTDLANDLGNLVLRTLTMIERYFDGKIPAGASPEAGVPESDGALRAAGDQLAVAVPALMDKLSFSAALDAIWALVRAANRYAEENQPWSLAKDPAQRERLGVVLYNLAEACRLLAAWLNPFIPAATEEIRTQFSCDETNGSFAERVSWGRTRTGTVIKKGKPLFPRLDLPGHDSGDAV